MSKMSVSVDVSKEAYELGQGLVKFVAAVKLAVADGWQLGSDMPAILGAAFAELVPAINGVQDLGAEFKEDHAAFAKAFALAAADLAGAFSPKSE